MARKFDYEFRGEERTVVIDEYAVDYDTNALDVSWHFDGVTSEEHDALRVTDKEEDEIVEAIGEYLGEVDE